MSSTRARLGFTTAASVVLLLASCSTADAPTAPPPAGPSLALSPDQRAEHERLKDLRDSLKAVFKAERQARHAEFESARDQWKLVKKEYRRLQRLGQEIPSELLICEPQEFAGDAEVIGPDGGSLRIGSHQLTIPRGALDHEVLISGTAPVLDHAEVELEPHGLTFARPAELELNYSRCIQPPAWQSVFIVYLGDQEQILEVTVSRDKKGIKTVAGDLEHFSRYAVAW